MIRLWLSRRTLAFLCLLAALFCLLYGILPDSPSRPAAVVADQSTATPVTGLPAAQIDTYPYEAGTPVPLPGQDGSGSGALASRSGASQGATSSDAVTCSDIHCIQHVVVLVLENQSFDRLFGVRPVRPKLVA